MSEFSHLTVRGGRNGCGCRPSTKLRRGVGRGGVLERRQSILFRLLGPLSETPCFVGVVLRRLLPGPEMPIASEDADA